MSPLRSSLALLALCVLPACEVGHGSGTLDVNGTVDTTRPPEGPKVEVVSGAPADGAPVERVAVSLDAAPARLSLAGGRVVVGTATGVLLQDGVNPNSFAALSVQAASGEPEATGAVRWLARRTSGGVLVAAEQGLFHDAEGALRYSPLSQSLLTPAVALDAVGQGEQEELWLIPADAASDPRVLHVAQGQLWTVRLGQVSAAPEVALGLGGSVGLIAAGGTLYRVDLPAKRAEVIAEGFGAAHAAERAGDGTAYVATDKGLFVRHKDGRVAQHTLAAEGASPARVLAVSAVLGEVVVTTEDLVARVTANGPVKVDARAHGASGVAAVTVDGTGDTWSVDDGALVRRLTGTPVSFAADVKPFFEAHCTSCHSAGSGSPQFDLTDYAVAVDRAQLIVKRLEANGVAPMPPQSVEILSPSDYAVVLRWVAGGMKP